MPKWWNKPVTWGDSFKAGGVGLAVSALAWGVMFAITKIEEHKEAERCKEWQTSLRQEGRMKPAKEEVEE